ncbi:MAG: hypothetical protein ACSHW6_10225 [Sulfitobacter geojensis]
MCSDTFELDATARFGHLDETSIGYFDGATYIGRATRAGCVITNSLAEPVIDARVKIVVPNPRRLFILMINALLAENPLDYDRTISMSQGQVSFGPSQIHETAVVMPGTRIGSGCVIEPAAIIFPGTVLEDGVTVKAASLVGSSGAAIDLSDEQTLSQPHLGTVLVKAHTEIGSQSNIVRGIFGTTTIGTRCVIGNQVNIGHNVLIGDGVWIGVGSIVAGYAKVGDFTNIGMGSLCKNGTTIGANCNVAMGSCLSKDLPHGASCFGNPAKATRFKLTAGPARPFEKPTE